MGEVNLACRPLGELAALLPGEQAARLEASAAAAAAALAGRAVWNVSATAAGGGVAEMLYTVLGYMRAAGVDARWFVLDGDEEFFAVTRRLHNAVRGLGDPAGLGPAAHLTYQRMLAGTLPGLLGMVGRRDLVMLHDPETAGLVSPLRRAGVRTAWRSHIGRDVPNEQSREAWEFLRRYIEDADAFIFSRAQYAPGWIPPQQLWVIAPSIDPLSAKNRPIPQAECRRVLTRAGLLSAHGAPPAPPGIQGAPPPGPGARLVAQVSRWDRLKDMAGVMAGLARAEPPGDVHLMLVAPAVDGVSDDPEGAEVLAECVAAWHRLPGGLRQRVTLASLPMDDLAQNARIINAIQRHAAVVVQKGIAEGFGLTVAEAMWKARPVLAAAGGGIEDQITHEREGLLVGDPTDLDAFAAALRRLLTDPRLGHRLGQAARQRAREEFLHDRHLGQSASLLTSMLAGDPAGPVAREQMRPPGLPAKRGGSP
jgi:trehalose synthase